MSTSFLDDKNFKIDSSAWQVQELQWIVAGKKVPLKVKINPEGDVREYISGVPTPYIGQQLFTYIAALRETQKAGKSLPENQQALHQAIETMSWTSDLQKYKNYLTNTGVQFAGCYSSWSHIFDDIGLWAYYRLDDGTRLHLNTTTWGIARRDELMGYSVRLG
jgi:hypothetical protein